MLIFKTEYLETYLVNFDETSIVEFKIRCSFLHKPNLKEIWNVEFLAVLEAMEWPHSKQKQFLNLITWLLDLITERPFTASCYSNNYNILMQCLRYCYIVLIIFIWYRYFVCTKITLKILWLTASQYKKFNINCNCNKILFMLLWTKSVCNFVLKTVFWNF